MIKHGWHLRFLRDYQKRGLLEGANPNTLGMIETIVCSRAQNFAGTWFSTFTGYIHRLRGWALACAISMLYPCCTHAVFMLYPCCIRSVPVSEALIHDCHTLFLTLLYTSLPC